MAEPLVELAQASLSLADVEAAAAELGFRLVQIDGADDADDGPGDSEKPDDEPAGNASTEVWAAYAVSRGASEDDLKDEDGHPLGRDELRVKYGTSAS